VPSTQSGSNFTCAQAKPSSRHCRTTSSVGQGATRSPRRGRVAQLTAALAHVWVHGYRPVRRRDEGSHTICGAAAVGSLGLGDDWEWRRRWPPTGSRITSRRLWPWPPAKLVPATSILRRPSTRRSLTCSTSGAERRSGGAVRRQQSCFGVAQVVRQREWSWGGSSGAASGAVQAGPAVDGEIEAGAVRYPGLAPVLSVPWRVAPLLLIIAAGWSFWRGTCSSATWKYAHQSGVVDSPLEVICRARYPSRPATTLPTMIPSLADSRNWASGKARLATNMATVIPTPAQIETASR